MTCPTTMKAIYKKLKKLGLDQQYVRRFGLPTWWDDELNYSKSAVLEGAGHISKCLNVDLTSLLEYGQEARFKRLSQEPKFKFQQQGEKEIPQVARQIASRVAKMVGASTALEFSHIPSTSESIRNSILSQHSRVDLDSLLHYCWSIGIAVVYFNEYPKQERKIDGMIQWIDDRPVIVLSSGKKKSANLAFHLAHELGHLALGHLEEGILLEGDISKKSDNEEEKQSNYFAAQLLLGIYDGFLRESRFRNARQLESRIKKICLNYPAVDPCILALNYAWYSKNYGMAFKVIDFFGDIDGDKVINQLLEKKINWDNLNDDDEDYLDKIVEV